jgi:hypothetical protein
MHTYDPPLLCVTHVYLGSGVQLQMNTICMQIAPLFSCIHMIHLSWVLASCLSGLRHPIWLLSVYHKVVAEKIT